MPVYIVACTQRIINSIKRFLIKEMTLRAGGGLRWWNIILEYRKP